MHHKSALFYIYVTAVITLTLNMSYASQHGSKRLSPVRGHSKRQSESFAAANGLSNPPSRYRFSGTLAQYAKFLSWPTVTPTTNTDCQTFISFQFRTHKADSLIMYVDDGGTSNFVAITLAESRIRVRFKFGSPTSVVLTGGNNLNDKRWHSVRIERCYPNMNLIVDEQRVTGSVTGKGSYDLVAKSGTYFGGLPKGFRLSLLSLPSIYFEARFSGLIRQIVMNGMYVRPFEKQGVFEEAADRICTGYRNPCQNNGVCYVRERTTACDCSNTKFIGKFCEEPYSDAVATFRGSEWISYDLSSTPVSSFNDEITLSFRTRQANGLILHTGKSADYVNLAIKDGNIQLVVNLGSGAYVVLVESVKGAFNDDKWHKVRVNRSLAKVDIVVDQANMNTKFLQDDFTQLTLDDVIYVGGSPSTADLPGSSVSNNFIGCLKEVTYSNNNHVRLPLSRLARDGDRSVMTSGDISFSCSDVDMSGPVTFMTSQSRLQISGWNNVKKGSVDFNFKTVQQNGLIVYGRGDTGDLFALEIFESFLYLVVNLGSGSSRFRKDDRRVDDGLWHRINVIRTTNSISLSVDGVRTENSITGSSEDLNLVGGLNVGGADFGNSIQALAGLWTAPLRQGYIGCIKDFRLDGDEIDLQSLAKSAAADDPNSMSRDIGPYCAGASSGQCGSGPCLNGGKCGEGMNRFICDCSDTLFRGTTCEESATIVGFDGSQFMTFPMSNTIQTEGEEISLRFKTPLSQGLIFATTSNTSKDSLKIEIVNGGKIKLTINIDCSLKNCTAPREGPEVMLQGWGLNDRQWHTLKVNRRGRRINLDVDGKRTGNTLSGRHNKLEFDIIHLGKIMTSPVTSRGLPTPMKSRSTTPAFSGTISNVVFNTVYLAESCLDGSLSCITNASFGDNFIVSNAVTFRDSSSYVSLDALDAYSSMDIFLTIKTTVRDGLILYEGTSSDYIAIELVNGKIYYIYNLGNGAQVLTVPGMKIVSDNDWHDIRVTMNDKNEHTLSVDQMVTTYSGTNGQLSKLDLNGYLFIGGVRQDMYYSNLPNQIGSRTGFQGCLGSLELNGRLIDIMGRDKIVSVGSVNRGCQGPRKSCSPASCMNGGICLQQWDSYTCDCSLTSFVGQRCEQHVRTLPEGTTFLFGSENGVIMYRWPNSYPSTRVDTFALGFSTIERSGLIMQVTGQTESSAQDYLQLFINRGKVTLRYNVGNRDIEVVEPMNVADGQYHTVQVRRQWMNATMRVDNWPERTVSPAGNARARFALAASAIPPSARPTIDVWLKNKEYRNSVFNSQSMIQIGGLLSNEFTSSLSNRKKRAPTPIIQRPFRGQMMGFFFNDVRVFQLAAQNDPLIDIIGDVTLIGEPPLLPPTTPTILQPMTTIATLTTFTSADISEVKGPIVYDCDDEEMCPNTSDYESGSGYLINNDFDTSKTTIHTTTQKPKQNTNDIDMLLFEMGFFTTTQTTLPKKTTLKPFLTTKKTKSKDGFYIDEVSEKKFNKENKTPATNKITKNPENKPSLEDILDLFTTKQIFDEELPSKNYEEVEFTTKPKLNKVEERIQNYPNSNILSNKNNKQIIKPTKETVEAENGEMASMIDILAEFGVIENKTETTTTQNPTLQDISPISNTNNFTQKYTTSQKQYNKTKPQYTTEQFLIAENSTSLRMPSTNILTNSNAPVLIFTTPSQPGNDIPTQDFSDTKPPGGINNKRTTLKPDLTGLNHPKPVLSSTKVVTLPPPTPILPLSTFKSTKSSTYSPSLSSVTKSSFLPPISPSSSYYEPSDMTRYATDAENNGVSMMGRTPDATKDTKTITKRKKIINTTESPNGNDSSTTMDTRIPIAVVEASSITTAMIAGIATAAGICILLLLLIMYRYKSRDVTYNVDARERDFGMTPTKGKKVVVKNGSVVRNGSSKKEQDKEYYV